MSISKETLCLITHSSVWLHQGTCAKTRQPMVTQDRGCPSTHSNLVAAHAMLRERETEAQKPRETEAGDNDGTEQQLQFHQRALVTL